MENNTTTDVPQEHEQIFYMVADLLDNEKREQSLLELSKRRERVPDLAIILWYSFGTIASLLNEIVSVYPLLSPPKLKVSIRLLKILTMLFTFVRVAFFFFFALIFQSNQSDRVCNALALLQYVASHKNTRLLFLNAHIPLFLYPFLNTVTKSRPFESLRLTSLGVIGALVKVDGDTEVINFLLSTEIIPLCMCALTYFGFFFFINAFFNLFFFCCCCCADFI